MTDEVNKFKKKYNTLEEKETDLEMYERQELNTRAQGGVKISRAATLDKDKFVSIRE